MKYHLEILLIIIVIKIIYNSVFNLQIIYLLTNQININNNNLCKIYKNIIKILMKVKNSNNK